MRLLLTSGGVSNAAIERALVGLLGKPVSEATALCIPTAEYGHPWCTPQSAWRFVSRSSHMTDLGWSSVGLLELTALPSIDPDRWRPWVEQADALLVDGGDAAYLAHWVRESGLLDLFPSLRDTVWVGMSAGSMVMTPRIGRDFVGWPHGGADDTTLGIVPFSIFPHLDHPQMPDNTLEAARAWAEEIDGPAYAIDDDTGISVVDGVVEVVSEGRWHQLAG